MRRYSVTIWARVNKNNKHGYIWTRFALKANDKLVSFSITASNKNYNKISKFVSDGFIKNEFDNSSNGTAISISEERNGSEIKVIRQ